MTLVIIIGTPLLQVLQNLMNLPGVSSPLNFPVMGVLADKFFQCRAAKKHVRQ